MKNMLLLLLASIVVPAWAGDAAPAAETGVAIEIKGSAKSVSALVADLEKDVAYKDAACSTAPAKKSAKTAKIRCAKADGALLTFLSKNTSAGVHWSISAAANTNKSISTAAPLACPINCSLTYCPPPGGPVRCCNNTTHMPC